MTRDVGFDAFSEAAITRAALLKRLLAGAAAVSVAGPAGVAYAGGQTAESAEAATALTLGLSGPVRSLDIARGFDIQSAVAYSLFLETLVTFDANLHLIPSLAKSWRQKNATTYIYEIRPGVKFSDGSTLTAQDVAFSLSRHADPKVGSEIASYMSSFKSATASGPLEVTVKLKHPDAFWPYLPTFIYIGRKSVILAQGTKYGAPGAQPTAVGTGPWTVQTFQADKGVTLVRNEQYWGRKPTIKNISIQVIEDANTRLLALRSGSIDGGFEVPPSQADDWKKVPGVHLYTAPGQRVYLYCFDFETKPFQDIHVRRAFAHAFDQETIVKGLIHGYGQPATSIVPPTQWKGLPGMTDQKIKAIYRSLQTYPFDLDKAKHELSQSSVPKGFKTHIEYPENQPEVGRATQVFAENLSKIGVTLSIKQVPFQKWSADTLSHKNLGLTNTTFYPDYPDPADYLNTHMSKNAVKNGVNYANYKNPKVDRLLNTQQRSSNPALRARLIAEVLRISARDLPYLPMWWENVLLGLDNKFSYAGAQGLAFYYYNWGYHIRQA
jgi:peptide/nickel transport system substrate-binding protein